MDEAFARQVRGLGASLPELSEIHCQERTGSTNEDAGRAGRGGAPHGSLWVAESQSAGKGRLGRSWESKPGLGLYFSLLLRPVLRAAIAPLATLAVGLGLAEGLRALSLRDLVVKWPNDLLIEGRKLGGILTEMVHRGDAVDFLVVGVGLNVAQEAEDFGGELRGNAISLRQATGRAWERASLLATLLPRVFTALDGLVRDGPEALRLAWEEKSGMVGKNIAYATDSGLPREGRVLGLDAAGRLRVEHADGSIAELIAEDTTLL